MKFAVRADAGVAMGIGHVMRCLSLLNQLAKLADSLEVLFICRDHSGHLVEWIRERGYQVKLLPLNGVAYTDAALGQHARWLGELPCRDAEQTGNAIQAHFGSRADWLIVDHYGIDADWHRQLQSQADRLMVIDDLADRQYACDLLLDQTHGIQASRYRSRVGRHCQILTGTRYALLRDEFRKSAEDIEALREKSWPPRKLLISLGGGDPDNVTGEVLDRLAEHRSLFDEVTVVIGHANPHLVRLQQQCQLNNATLLQAVGNMAELLMQHDIAIGAAGASSWERCALGLPSLVLVTAENQNTVCSQLEAAGAIRVIARPIDQTRLVSSLSEWISNKQQYMSTVNSSLAICDGQGSKRVADVLLAIGASTDIKVSLRVASVGDGDVIYAWQSQPETRRHFMNANVPSYPEHCQWFSQSLMNENREVFIIEYEGSPAGVLRFDRVKNEPVSFEVSILVSADFYQRGISKNALVLAQYLWPKRNFSAFVKSQNEASLSLFKSAGFTFDGEKFVVNR